METVIVSIICIAMIVFGGMTMSQGFLTSVDASTAGLEEIGLRDEIFVRTALTPVNADQPSADTVEIILENSGQSRLGDYDDSANYHVEWLPFTEDPLDDNEWEVAWIRLNGQAELYEPNVLNPGEQIMIRGRIDPPAGAGTTNMAVVVTPCGVSASTYFSP
jgi:hypothetical protein